MIADDSKWITIHPGDSKIGVHIKVDGRGNAIGGNPHLVNALNDNNPKASVVVRTKQEGLPLDPPTEEVSSILDLWDPPDVGDFESLLDDYEPPKMKLDFQKRIAEMKDAPSYLGNTVKQLFFDVDDFVHTIASDLSYSLQKKLRSTYRMGSKATRAMALKNIAVTMDYLKGVLKPNAIDFSNINVLPCSTKGAIASFSTECYVNSSFSGNKTIVMNCLNIAPTDPKQLEFQEKARQKLKANPDKTPHVVQSRYPKEDSDFLLCCHEVAHAAYHLRKLKYSWSDTVNQALSEGFDFEKKVSRYAWIKKSWSSKINECHSECFAMMCHPDYKRGTLPKVVEDYFDDKFFLKQSA